MATYYRTASKNATLSEFAVYDRDDKDDQHRDDGDGDQPIRSHSVKITHFSSVRNPAKHKPNTGVP